MSRRFRGLERTIKTKQTTIDAYKAYKAGDVDLTRKNVATLDKRLFYIYPFALEAAPLNHTPVYCSGRAIDNIADVLVDGLTLLHLDSTGAEGAGGYISTFEPAKAIITKKGTKVETDPTSQITGLKYTAYNNETFTYPFGQAATGITYYNDLVAEIMEAVESKQPKNSVTFKPERWRQR